MIVIDSSLAFKWFNSNEADADKAIAVWQDHVDGKIPIVVPDLIVYELANAWATKTALSLKEIKDNLDAFFESKLEIVYISANIINEAVAFSRKYQVSVYDSIYVVLAKEKKCLLITADKRLTEKIDLLFVRLL